MHVIFIPCTHQVLERQHSGSGSDAMTPSPIKARASVDIYNLYGVTMPPYVEVQSSPERILSQAAPDDPAYDEHSEESSRKDMKPQVAPAYSPRRVRVTAKTSPKEQVQIAASNDDPDYVDLVRKVDLDLVRTYKDSSQQVVKLTEGPSGFCVALMKEGTITTEIPVLALLPPTPKVVQPMKVQVFKQKPAAFCKKKRSASTKVDCIVVFTCIYIYI